jgi:hypothetical protein
LFTAILFTALFAIQSANACSEYALQQDRESQVLDWIKPNVESSTSVTTKEIKDYCTSQLNFKLESLVSTTFHSGCTFKIDRWMVIRITFDPTTQGISSPIPILANDCSLPLVDVSSFRQICLDGGRMLGMGGSNAKDD